MGYARDEFPNTSYYKSDLREILKNMREFESKLSAYDEVIEELKRELENIGGLYDRVAALEEATADLSDIRSSIRELVTDLEHLSNKEKADIANLQEQINSIKNTIDGFERKVKDLYNYINHNVSVLNSRIDKESSYLMGVINDLRVSLENILNYLLWRLDQIDTSVLNPWHTDEGRITQDRNVKHIYADLADGCLTAEEYCKLGLTANEYSEFGITARQYAKHGKERLHFYWVYSPVHGWRQDINVVLTDVINNCEGTMTATRYAEMELTADEYSAIGLTAKSYYGYNPEKVGIYVEDGVMQSDQYYIQVIDGVVQFAGVEVGVEDGVLSFD